jgi:hypothetical protein
LIDESSTGKKIKYIIVDRRILFRREKILIDEIISIEMKDIL